MPNSLLVLSGCAAPYGPPFQIAVRKLGSELFMGVSPGVREKCASDFAGFQEPCCEEALCSGNKHVAALLPLGWFD